MRRPSLPEIDAALKEYVRSSHPPSTARALAEALLVEQAVRREVRRDLGSYASDTGRHVIMPIELAQERMMAMRIEEDAERWRWVRSTAGKITTHVLTAVIVAGLAMLWHVLAR